jgi:hypothetical protein
MTPFSTALLSMVCTMQIFDMLYAAAFFLILGENDSRFMIDNGTWKTGLTAPINDISDGLVMRPLGMTIQKFFF